MSYINHRFFTSDHNICDDFIKCLCHAHQNMSNSPFIELQDELWQQEFRNDMDAVRKFYVENELDCVNTHSDVEDNIKADSTDADLIVRIVNGTFNKEVNDNAKSLNQNIYDEYLGVMYYYITRHIFDANSIDININSYYSQLYKEQYDSYTKKRDSVLGRFSCTKAAKQ